MSLSRILLAVALSCLLVPAALPPAAADHGDAGRARYVLAEGQPEPFRSGYACLDLHRAWTGGTLLLGPLGEHPIPVVRGPEVWVGGACFAVAPGAYAVDVVDDSGAAPEYTWFLQGDGNGCHHQERASGPIVVEVPEGCSWLAVAPVAGSVSGTIEVR